MGSTATACATLSARLAVLGRELDFGLGRDSAIFLREAVTRNETFFPFGCFLPACFSSFSSFDWRRSEISWESSDSSSAFRADLLASFASFFACLSLSLAARAVCQARRAIFTSCAAFVRAKASSLRTLSSSNMVFMNFLFCDGFDIRFRSKNGCHFETFPAFEARHFGKKLFNSRLLGWRSGKTGEKLLPRCGNYLK